MSSGRRLAGAFGVAPDEFVGVEVWGIAGQEMHRQLAIEFVHVVPYQACPVRGKAIDDQVQRLAPAAHHAAQQGDEQGSVQATSDRWRTRTPPWR